MAMRHIHLSFKLTNGTTSLEFIERDNLGTLTHYRSAIENVSYFYEASKESFA